MSTTRTRSTVQSDTSVFDDVTEYWNRRAPLFDGAASHVRHKAEWLIVLRAAFATADAKDVLDLGSGTGACALAAAELGHRVTAIDGAAKMLAHARRNALLRGLDINFIVSSIDDFAATPGSADIVTIRNVLWTLKDPLAALKKARMLLRPDGRIVVSDGLWSVDPGNQSTYTTDLAARLPFHAGLTQPDAEKLLNDASFGDVHSWHHLLNALPYPGGAPFFVLSAVTPVTR
ncbi:class I SAM-dependent methyltransferase [Mesorhizobium sp. WSM2240]